MLASPSLKFSIVLPWRLTLRCTLSCGATAYEIRWAGRSIVHETPLEWLQAGREGVFVIDPQGASPLLRMVEPLAVKRPEFGRQLLSALTIRAPRIVVAENRRAA